MARWALALALVGGALAGRVPRHYLDAVERSPREDLPRAFGGLSPDLLGVVMGLLPRRTLVAAAGGGSSAVLWANGDSKGPTRQVSVELGNIVDMQFLPDGDRLALALSDGSVMLWATDANRPTRVLAGHAREAVFQLRVFPCGEKLVTVGGDGYAIIWSAVSGEAILRMSPKDVAGSAHQFVRVFPDGGRIVTGVGVSQGKDAVIWNATSGESLLEISSRHMGFEPPVTMLELSPCGEMLVTTSRFWAFYWDTVNGHLQRATGANEGVITSVALSAHGRRAVLVRDCGALFINDLALHPPLRMTVIGPGLHQAVMFPGGDRFVVYSSREAIIWEAGSLRKLHTLPGVQHLKRLVVSPDGALVAGCSAFRFGRLPGLSVWSSDTGAQLYASSMPTTGSWSSWLAQRIVPWVVAPCNVVIS